MDNGGPSQRQPITQAPLPSFLTVLVVVLEMRSSYFATIHIIALLGFSLLARASVIFPQNIHHHHSNRRRNQLKRKGQSSLLNKRNNLIDFRSLRRTPSAHPPEFRNGEYGMIQSLTSLSLGRTGGLVLVGSTAIHLINKLRSEAFKRAIYFWYHAGPIVVHYKFTQWFLTKTKAPLEKRHQVYDSLHNRYCEKSFGVALNLQGLYVKLAQIISSRPDFVPPQYIDLFITAQDSIPQWAAEDVVSDIEKSLNREFGLSFNDVFESIESTALGSASIGQVHKAKLKSEFSNIGGYGGGDSVAVKVMHRGAEDRFHHDFQVFRWLCRVALKGWEPILDECYRQIMSEFDYRREAKCLSLVRQNMAKSPFKRKIRIPEPVTKLCSKELLVMQMLEGKKLSDAIEDELALALGGKDKAEAMIKKKRLELILGKDNIEVLNNKESSRSDEPNKDLRLGNKLRLYSLYKQTKRYIDLLVDVQGHQVLKNGLFNGDPHVGNILKMPDGSLGLVDYGQTKSLSNEERLGVARVVNALGNGSSEQEIANQMRNLGFKTKFNDDKIIAKYAALFFDSDVDAKLMGCATPQLYFAKLTTSDPLVNVPDVAIFVARASFILRGMGTLLERQIRTSVRWAAQAKLALEAV